MEMKCICGCQRNASELHEIFFGHGKKQVCVKYSIQSPLNRCCHTSAHRNRGIFCGSRFDKMSQEEVQQFLCEKMGINFERTRLAVNLSYRKEQKEYLEKISVGLKKMLDKK
jgi:hypothetical protein